VGSSSIWIEGELCTMTKSSAVSQSLAANGTPNSIERRRQELHDYKSKLHQEVINRVDKNRDLTFFARVTMERFVWLEMLLRNDPEKLAGIVSEVLDHAKSEDFDHTDTWQNIQFSVPRTLAVSAVAPDGVIEGLEDGTKRFFIGVQWHPEYLYPRFSTHRALFEALVAAARSIRQGPRRVKRRAVTGA